MPTEEYVSDQDLDEDGEEEEIFTTAEDSDEKKSFLTKLNKFMQERGTPIGKLPQLGGRTLDLYRLYREVIIRGGTEIVRALKLFLTQKVTEKKLWKDVTMGYKVPKTCTSASYSLRNHYKRYLYAYEQVLHFGKKDPVESMPHPVVPEQNTPQHHEETDLKRSWTEMAGPTVSLGYQYHKKPKTMTQSTMEQMRRIECSIECREEPHVDWALTKVAQLSLSKTKKFHLDSIRGLLFVLVDSVKKYVLMPRSKSDFFNTLSVHDRLLERLAFISLIIIRNSSFDVRDKKLIVSAKDEEENSLVGLLLRLFQLDIHLEWQIKIFDILVNIGTSIQLERDTDILLSQLRSCICDDTDEPLRVNALELLSLLIAPENAHAKHNADVLSEKLQGEFSSVLSSTIGFLRTSTSINHVNEPDDEDSDDEERQIEDSEDEESRKSTIDLEALEERDVAKHHTLEQQKQQQEKLKAEQKLEASTTTKYVKRDLEEIDLLCRSLSLNFITRLVHFASVRLVSVIAHTNNCITRLVDLLVWKSGLQSRMKTNSYEINRHLREKQRQENKVQKDTQEFFGQAQYQHVNIFEDAEDEDFDQDEVYDDYGIDNAPSDVSSSQLFQRRCANILAEFTKMSTDARNTVAKYHQHEIMFLVMFTKQFVSQPLTKCVI